MAFSEIKLFQVKPNRVEDFELLIKEVQKEQATMNGCVSVRYIKRFFVLDKLEPRELTRVVKCVKYLSYWEFDCRENYSAAIKIFFEKYEKPIQRLLIMPFDIFMGENLEC